MPQEFLDHPQVDASLQQVRRIGMAQGMDRRLLVDSTLEQNDLKGLLQGGGRKGLTALFGGKKIEMRAALSPIVTQQLQQSLREGNAPILPPFAVADPDQHPCTVNVMHLQLYPFGKTEAAGVDDGQNHANGEMLNKRKDVFHFVGTQDDRKLFPLSGPNEVKDEPFPLEGFLEEKLDAAKMYREGAARNASFLHKVEEIGAEFFLGNVFRGTVVMLGKTPDGSEVGGLRLCRVPMQLHVLDHSLSDCAHCILLSVWVCVSQGNGH